MQFYSKTMAQRPDSMLQRVFHWLFQLEPDVNDLLLAEEGRSYPFGAIAATVDEGRPAGRAV